MPWRFMKALAKALELSSWAAACVGPKMRRPAAAELVHHAGRQRRFGPDHGQRDLFGSWAQSRSAARSVMGTFLTRRGVERRAAVARRHVDLLHLG
jgi:hypothetical protein